jgi:hypothetical protein
MMFISSKGICPPHALQSRDGKRIIRMYIGTAYLLYPQKLISLRVMLESYGYGRELWRKPCAPSQPRDKVSLPSHM